MVGTEGRELVSHLESGKAKMESSGWGKEWWWIKIEEGFLTTNTPFGMTWLLGGLGRRTWVGSGNLEPVEIVPRSLRCARSVLRSG